MIVLLPPSETKSLGGEGAPLQLESLGWPELNSVRAELVDDLVTLSADRPAARRALGLTDKQDGEIDRNTTLLTSATRPAIDRYTGVLYDALDIGSLRGATAARVRARLAVGSALFGLVGADDPIPAYRLSAGSKLPGRPTLPARWRPALEPVLADIATSDLVVDLRSGSYAGLGRISGAVTVDVVSENSAGKRTVVSHFNKAHKGRFARILASSRSEPDDAAKVAAIARRAGMQVERAGHELTVVIPA